MRKAVPKNPSFVIWILIPSILVLGLGHVLLAILERDPVVLQLASDFVNPLIGILAAVVMGMAAWALVPGGRRRALAWALLGAAILFSSAGDVAWMVYDLTSGGAPVPSIADGFYLLFYLLFLGGVFLIPVKRMQWMEWLKGVFDILIVLLTATMALWIFILGPAVASYEGEPFISQALLGFYALGDVVLLSAQLIVLFSAGGYPLRSSLWMLVSGLTAFIVADVGYSYLSQQGLYQAGVWTDSIYSLAYMLFGLAGFHEYRAVHLRHTVKLAPFSNPALWVQLLPYLWMVVAYWILVVVLYQPQVVSVTRVAMFAGLVTVLVVLRQVLSLQENQRLSENLGKVLQQVKLQAYELEQANREMHIEILERRRMAERLSYDALHDGLTGLPNRALFLDRLAQASRKKMRQPGVLYSVMFLDLDGFKLVNDSLGHLLGDRLLVRVAGILRGCVRATDTVARLGGDEFVILVEDVSDSRSVIEMANRVQTELRQPIDLDGTPVYTTASIGVVLNVSEYQRPEDMLRDADLAMYHAKSLGKARYVIFNPTMRDMALSRMAMEGDLRKAIERGEFFIEYQPVFQLSSMRPVGVEALLRWQHPERGRLEPGAFILVAEEAGLISEIGQWCLMQACQQARSWQNRFGPLKMGVNVSGRQFHDPGFVGMVRDTLQASQLNGRSLILEVPENICLENLDSLRSAMSDLSELGVEIQIDDFGTGYSALGYLQSLVVHAIKIDRSFIEPISAEGDPRANEIVRAILAMMRTLGVETWAEGIETELHLNELVRMGCQLGQGYYLARPMLAPEMEVWLSSQINSAQK